MSVSELKCYKTYQDIVLPKFATDGSACFDIAFQMAGKFDYKVYNQNNKEITRQFSNNRIQIMPGERVMVPTGLIFDIPEEYSLRIHSRSGLALKKGLVLANAEGIVDSDYTEEVFVILQNISSVGILIDHGERIAQAELVPVVKFSLVETKTAPKQKTTRAGGFGSTGTKAEIKTETTEKSKKAEKPKRSRTETKGKTPVKRTKKDAKEE